MTDLMVQVTYWGLVCIVMKLKPLSVHLSVDRRAWSPLIRILYLASIDVMADVGDGAKQWPLTEDILHWGGA